MKAESTIRRMIQRLRAIAENETETPEMQREAWHLYLALRWAIDKRRSPLTPIDLLPGQPKREREVPRG